MIGGNWFILGGTLMYLGSAVYDLFVGNYLRSALFFIYASANVVIYFMEM